MRLVACIICAFLLLSGAFSPVHAAGSGRGTVAAKTKTTYTYSLTPTVGEYLFDGREKLNPSQIYGLTFSYNILSSEMMSSLGIDAVAGYIDTTSKIDNSAVKIYHFRVDAIYPFILKNSGFTPLFAAGVGGNFYERSTSSEKKVLFDYGLGLKYKLRDYLNARADVRHIVLFAPERFNNVECTVGLTYVFGVERKSDLKEPEKDKKDKKQGKKEIEGKEGKKTRTPGKIEDSSVVAKAEKEGDKKSAEKAPETGKKPEGGESAAPAATAATATAATAAPTTPGTVQVQTSQTAAAAKGETGSTTGSAAPAAASSTPSVTAQAVAPQPAAVPTESGTVATATTATGKRATVGKAQVTGKKLDGRNIAKPVEAVPPAAAVSALTGASQMPAPESAAAPTEGEATVTATVPAEERTPAEKAPVAVKKSASRNIAKPVEAIPPSAVVSPQTAAVAKAETAPAAEAPSVPVAAAPAAAPVEVPSAPVAAGKVSPVRTAVPAAAKPTITTTTPVGETARETITPVAEAPSSVPTSAPAESKVVAGVPAGEAARETTTPAAAVPAAPPASRVNVAPAPAAAPESKIVPPAMPSEPTIAATTPAGEAAGKTTAPVAKAPSKLLPPAPVTAPVEVAPAPIEREAATTTAEPAVPSPAYKAPPEETRQLPEPTVNVSPAAPAVARTEDAVALTAITGTEEGVDIRTSVPVPTVRYFRMSKPARLVIDLPGTSNGTGRETFSLGRFGLAGARVSTYRGRLRIVLDAMGKTFPRYRVEKSTTGLRVALVESAPPVPEAAPAPVETEQEYLLRFTIEFDTAKAFIRPQYDAMMRKAADFLLSNPDTVAEIRGHTDSIGKARYNVLLSQRRAGSVRKFFVKKYGVDGSRVIVRGFGYYFPIADNATVAGRQKNRRTEVTIAIRKAGATPKPGSEGRSSAPAGGEAR